MALPPLSPEERAANLAKAVRVRQERAEVKSSLKRGDKSLTDVLAEAKTSDVIGKTKVSDLLRSVPGVGEVRARKIMEQIGIAENRRAAGLGAQQYAALKQEFASV